MSRILKKQKRRYTPLLLLHFSYLYVESRIRSWAISDFHREGDENCALLGYYATCSGNLLPTFRDNLSGPIFRGQEFFIPGDGLVRSVINYHYSLRNNPEEFSSRLLRGGSLKSHIFWECVCSLCCTACKAHASYYVVICGPNGSTIPFPCYIINGTIFEENYWLYSVIFSFCLQLLSATFLFIRRGRRYVFINIHVFM